MNSSDGLKNNKIYEGNTGKIFLQLSKSYKGDNRFKLDENFQDDLDLDKLPNKFHQIVEKGAIQKASKKKKIKKDKPLIIQRFEPGSCHAQKIVKKAEDRKKYEEGIKKSEIKKITKNKVRVQHGVDKVKKAQQILGLNPTNSDKKPQFQIDIKGNRKEAFKPQEFKLFG